MLGCSWSSVSIWVLSNNGVELGFLVFFCVWLFILVDSGAVFAAAGASGLVLLILRDCIDKPRSSPNPSLDYNSGIMFRTVFTSSSPIKTYLLAYDSALTV